MKTEDPGLTERVEFIANPLAKREVRMAVRNNLPGKKKLIADFNRTLQEMRADGSLEALLVHHRID